MYLPARHTQPPTAWIFDAQSGRLLGRVVLRRHDLRELDAVARICRDAKRIGQRPTLRGGSPELTALLDLAGLTRAVGVG